MMEATSTAMAHPETAQAPSRPLLAWLGTLGGVFLGCVLLFAVWAKALDPAAFAEQIHSLGLDFALPAQAVALIALALEAGLGLALLLGLRRSWVLVPAALLVAFFLSLARRARPTAGYLLRLLRQSGPAHAGSGVLAGPPVAGAGAILGFRGARPARTALPAAAHGGRCGGHSRRRSLRLEGA